MATYTEYLDFDTEEDKIETAAALSGDRVIGANGSGGQKDQPSAKLAACRCAILPRLPRVCTVYSKIAELNPNIRVNYIARKDFDDSSRFNNPRQQEIIRANQKIPALFLMGHEEEGACV